MVRDRLFADLPPPSSSAVNLDSSSSGSAAKSSESSFAAPHDFAPKSAIKRHVEDERKEGMKKVCFKTSMEASSEQIVGAMQKIASHIGNPSKFSKASKLALQLLQSGGVTKETVDLFFDILKVSMLSPNLATEPSLRQGYHDLFSAVSEQFDCFSQPQQAQLQVWFLWALVANDLLTDDTFVFSKAACRVRQCISSLPNATAAEDAFDAATANQSGLSNKKQSDEDSSQVGDAGCDDTVELTEANELDSDPFGLNALVPKSLRKEERAKRKKEEEAAYRKVQEDEYRLLQERREALMECLKIGAGRYRLQWAQTIIDIMVKQAFDDISKFTAQQRNAIKKLWGSVKEQQVRRKQGKTGGGKLDVTAFERLQNEYAQAKISIRHAVGASGDRSAEQWLG